jgi:hypothetical protein
LHSPIMTTTYHHTQQLRFKHLAKHELFMFPAGNGTPQMGPYMKISPRRYVEATVSIVGGTKIVPHIKASPVYTVGTINVAVSDRVTDGLY